MNENQIIMKKLIDYIGNTPMLEIKNITNDIDCNAKIFVKAERFNPGGSVKDRVALSMIEDAEQRGLLKPGGTIIEPTSGNTGIGLAWIGKSKGYNVILTMPDTMSEERRKLLRAYGASLELTPGVEGMSGAIRRAEELASEIEGSIIPGQFTNPANPAIHEHTTGPEIIRDTDGKIDIFVAGVGTGGTITGVSRALKKFNNRIQVVAVEPFSSAVLSGGQPGLHKIQGIGAGFIPANYDATVVDDVIKVSDEDAIEITRLIARKEGLLVGISSGAAVYAALELARKPENIGKFIVALLPDSGERYLSMSIY